MSRAKSIAAHVAIAAAISLALIWGNTLFRQWSQYSKGEAAIDKGDFMGAISAYEAALHMYTPLGPFIEPSAERLWAVGRNLELKGDSPKALIAYRALRSSFYAVRGLYSPGAEWIARCDTRIAALINSPPAGR